MKEQLSALMDSELSDAEAQRLIKSMKANPALQQSWDSYHVISDVLRKSPVMSSDFSAKLSQRLAQEPTILAPHRPLVALNPSPRRLSMSIAASVAAASLVGILGLQIARVNQSANPASVALAPIALQIQTPQANRSAPPTELVTLSPTPARVKFARATPNTYLLAHQEFSPSYAPTYARTVPEELETAQ